MSLYVRKFDGRYSSMKRLVENFENTDTDKAGSTIGSILKNPGVTMFEAAHRTGVWVRSIIVIVLSTSTGKLPSGPEKKSATSILRTT